MNKKVLQKLTAITTAAVLAASIAPMSASAAWNKDANSNWSWTENGQKSTGWKLIHGNWYYFDGSGIMQTGWKFINGQWYYMDQSGAMKTGWQFINGEWYHLAANGAMTKGWYKEGSYWYHLNENGVMSRHWRKISNKWYHFNPSGQMSVGWINWKNNHYFSNKDGVMQTGLVQIDNKIYYFDEVTGELQTGRIKVGNVTYTFGEDGAATGALLPKAEIAFDANGNEKTPGGVISGGDTTAPSRPSYGGGGGGGGSSYVEVQSISLNKTSHIMYVGDDVLLTAAVYPSNATDRRVTWISSDESIATVTNGYVHALKAGTVTIKAIADTVEATCTVEIMAKGEEVKVTGITVTSTSGKNEAHVGESLQLQAAVTPANATNKAVNWSSSDNTVATVSTSGLVSAVKEGTATITATAADGSGVTGTFAVTVTKKPATESATPTFTKDLDTAKNVTEGDSVTLSVTASASDGGKLTYQWYKGSTAISGATGASYTFTADKVGSESYKVVVTNTKDSLTPATATSKTCVVTTKAAPVEDVEITGFVAIDKVVVSEDEHLTTAALAAAKLPAKVTLQYDGGTVDVDATWACANYNAESTEDQTFTASYTLPTGYVDAVDPITVTATVKLEVAQTTAPIPSQNLIAGVRPTIGIGIGYIAKDHHENSSDMSSPLLDETYDLLTDGVYPAADAVYNEADPESYKGTLYFNWFDQNGAADFTFQFEEKTFEQINLMFRNGTPWGTEAVNGVAEHIKVQAEIDGVWTDIYEGRENNTKGHTDIVLKTEDGKAITATGLKFWFYTWTDETIHKTTALSEIEVLATATDAAADGTLTGGSPVNPELTTIDYAATGTPVVKFVNGLNKAEDLAKVTYADGKFTVADDVTSFSFVDSGVAKQFTNTEGVWSEVAEISKSLIFGAPFTTDVKRDNFGYYSTTFDNPMFAYSLTDGVVPPSADCNQFGYVTFASTVLDGVSKDICFNLENEVTFKQINIDLLKQTVWNAADGYPEHVTIEAKIGGTWATIGDVTGLDIIGTDGTAKTLVFTAEEAITADGLRFTFYARQGNTKAVILTGIDVLAETDGSAADGLLVAPSEVAETPTITTDLEATKNVNVGEKVNLAIEATVSDGGTLSYQWYKDGVAIKGATSNTYSFTAFAAGTATYKVEVTNTKDGMLSSMATSTVCTVTVSSEFVNIAKGKPYTFSTEHLNFANADDGVKLTDDFTPNSTSYGDAGFVAVHTTNDITNLDIVIDLGAEMSFKQVTIDTLLSTDGIKAIESGSVSYSSDNSTWTELGTISHTQTELGVETILVQSETPVTGRYVKLSYDDSNSWHGLAEIRVWGEAGETPPSDTSVDYTATGTVADISSGVTFADGKFSVPETVSEFTFTDNGVSLKATKTDSGWTIAGESLIYGVKADSNVTKGYGWEAEKPLPDNWQDWLTDGKAVINEGDISTSSRLTWGSVPAFQQEEGFVPTYTFELDPAKSFKQIRIGTVVIPKGDVTVATQPKSVKIELEKDGEWVTLFDNTDNPYTREDQNKVFVFSGDTAISGSKLRISTAVHGDVASWPGTAINEIEVLADAATGTLDGELEAPEAPPVDTAATPTIDTDLEAAKTVTVGDTVTFTVAASTTDEGTLSYQWYKDDAAIDGATDATYTISAAAETDAGSYKVVVTNTNGTATATATSTACVLTVETPVVTDNLLYGIPYTTAAEYVNFAYGHNPQEAPESVNWLTDGDAPLTGSAADAGHVAYATAGVGDADFTFDFGKEISFRQITLSAVKEQIWNAEDGLPDHIKIEAQIDGIWKTILDQDGYDRSASKKFVFATDGEEITATGLKFYLYPRNGVAAAVHLTEIEALAAAGTATDGTLAILNIAQTPVLSTNLNLTGKVAENGSLPLTVEASVADGGDLSYQWYKNGTEIVGANEATYTIANAAGADTASYHCVVKNTLGDTTATSNSNKCYVTVYKEDADNLIAGKSFTSSMDNNNYGFGYGPVAHPEILDSLTDGFTYEPDRDGNFGGASGMVCSGGGGQDLVFDLGGVKEFSQISVSTKHLDGLWGASLRAPGSITVEVDQGDGTWINVYTGAVTATGSDQKIVLGSDSAIAASKVRISWTKSDGSWGTAVDEVEIRVSAPEGQTDGTMTAPTATTLTNLALNRPYTISTTTDGELKYANEDDGVKLTDGKVATSPNYLDSTVVVARVDMGEARPTDATFDIVVDLGAEKSFEEVSIETFRQPGPGVYEIRYGTVSYSSDGNEWTQFDKDFEHVLTAEGLGTITLKSTPVTGRYVKLTVKDATWWHPCSEIRVLGEAGETPPADTAATPTIDTDLEAAKTANAGDEVTFTVAASTTDEGTLSYQWYKDDVAIDGATEATYTIASATTEDAGSYKVVVTNTNGTATATATSTVCVLTVEAPVVSNNLLAGKTSTCAIPNGALAYWMSDGSGLSPDWNAKLTDGVISTAATAYDEDWENILYIAGHDTASYEADFTWTFDEASFEQVNIHTNLGDPWNGYANGNGQTDHVKIQAKIDGTWATIYEGTGLKNDSNAPRKYVFTSDEPITATGLKVWLFAGNRDGVLPVAVSEIEALKTADGSTADGTLVKPAVIAKTPSFTTDLSATKDAAVGDTVTMSVEASVTDGGTITYQWYKNDVQIDGATEVSYTINNAQVSDGGNYRVVATNTVGEATAFADSTVCYLSVKDPSNLAQGCSYTVTEGLNFSGDAKNDGKKLTDGQIPGSTAYGNAGYMTAHNPNGTTADIIIDLGAVKSFQGVSIDTLKGADGVYPLRSATIYGSETGEDWNELGKITNDEGAQAEGEVKTVSLTASGTAQYIKVTVEQAANWFSLAEIRVLA